ncbi:MAG: hypothetical protein JHC76_07330 [Akkermansiaceae bacterium]|nr:hypothetical protein [Akkermansiaceae bacterium]
MLAAYRLLVGMAVCRLSRKAPTQTQCGTGGSAATVRQVHYRVLHRAQAASLDFRLLSVFGPDAGTCSGASPGIEDYRVLPASSRTTYGGCMVVLSH